MNGGSVEIIADVVYELDSDGKRLAPIKFTDYTQKQVRSMYTSASELRSKWSDAQQRRQILSLLRRKGSLLNNWPVPQKDLTLIHLIFYAMLPTMPQFEPERRRAELLRRDKKDFFDRFGDEARKILNEMLDKYIEFGTEQLTDTNILKVPPISLHGNLMEISGAIRRACCS